MIRTLIMENNQVETEIQEMEVALEDLPEFPTAMLSKIDKAVDHDIEQMENGHAGDEAVGSLIAGAVLSLPIIIKCIKWIAKGIGVILSGGGYFFDYESNFVIDGLQSLEETVHHAYEHVFESIGGAIFKLITQRDPTEAEKKHAGKVLNFAILLCVGIWGFQGLLHALHSHHFWLECGEAFLGCIGYGEGVYLLIMICEFAQGKQITLEDAEQQKEELGFPDTPIGSVNFA